MYLERWEKDGKSLNTINFYKSIMNRKEINEQLIGGNDKNLNISSIIAQSIEESDIKINEIPKLKFYKIKERILESFINTIK